MRTAALAVLVLLLAACARQPTRPDLPPRDADRPRPKAGELYAPHIRDGGPPVPPDISRIAEPIPVNEPPARYGNRSPYTVLGKTYRVMETARGYRERGQASWYGNKFHGRPTSSFEPYDMYKFTAAHKTLPLPSFVRVTNLENGRSVVVRVNDRGPFHDGRIIDLSYAAAVKLGMHLKGVASVEVEAIDPDRTRFARRDDEALPLHRSASSAPRGAPVLPWSRGGGRVTVQVASFGDKDNARRLQDRLEDAGVADVDLQRADVGDRTVWRVRVGPLKQESQLAELRRVLRGMGLGEPQVVRAP
jgi:rare lipoprotein A